MSEKKIMLTYDGLKNLETELQVLKTERRKDVAEKIKDARGQGDLSENAEYDSAKEEQAEIEARIVVLEKMLRNAEVIDEEDLTEGAVSVGHKVVVLDKEFSEQVEYSIVGSAEADPFKGKISNESPLGAALLGRTVGDTVTVDAPDGVIEYEIIAIN
ncbi:MAG: transcription elongation factor GreA [Defluviitaleaceae bacterium]|nr:transcription elongation factor GreA [Defluviitaleaceae bacterium]